MAKRGTSSKKSGAESKPKTTAVVGLEADLSRLEAYLELMKKYSVSELFWERESETLNLRTGSPSAPASVTLAGAVGPSTYAGLPPSLSAPAFVAPAAAGPAKDAVASKSATAQGFEPSGGVSAAASTASQESKGKKVTSPFVGTFYRASSPGADPYVREGQVVKKGQVLCLIEAMKLMNEIEAEQSGKIVSVLVENGQPVEFGEPLFVIEPA